jgi:5-enolpyruvylshikimate-3-phosphate synthase
MIAEIRSSYKSKKCSISVKIKLGRQFKSIKIGAQVKSAKISTILIIKLKKLSLNSKKLSLRSHIVFSKPMLRQLGLLHLCKKGSQFIAACFLKKKLRNSISKNLRISNSK